MAESDPDGTHASPPRPTHDPLRSTPVNAGGSDNVLLQSDPIPEKLGQFEIKMLLGEGACGRVYLGFDPELQRKVAIKQPHRARLTDEFRERFIREARATAKIHHPNICPVYFVGTDVDPPYIVMHYVAGGTLAGLLDSDGPPLQVKQKLTIAWKLAKGLTAAHKQEVIHRDLKPANVLYDKDRREVLITDFGLARIGTQARGTLEGAVFGTPAYMPPEQARGQTNAIGPLSDVYSLGVILYEMLTGRVPFTGTVWDVMRQHCEATPHPPSKVRPGLDSRLDAICAKAMAKNPADRYQSAKEFADAIADLLRGEPVDRGGVIQPDFEPDPEPPVPPPVSGKQGTGKGPPPIPSKPRVAPQPPVQSVDSHAQRKRRGLQIVALLMLLFAIAVGVVIAVKPPPKEKLPEPDSQAKTPAATLNKFDQAVERKAAEQLFDLKKDLDLKASRTLVFKLTAEGKSKAEEATTAADLPTDFTISEIEVKYVSRDIDAQLRACLTGLSGPLELRFEYVSFLSDETLAVIARIPKLKLLRLKDTPRVTDAGLAILTKHPELQELDLANLNLTSSGLAVTLRNLPTLTALRLDRSLVSDELLVALKSSGNLTELDLNWNSVSRTSRVTRAGVESLAALKQLTKLTLSSHPVEDSWLPTLYSLKKLETVDLSSANTTEDGRKALRKQLGATCKVKPEPPPPVDP